MPRPDDFNFFPNQLSDPEAFDQLAMAPDAFSVAAPSLPDPAAASRQLRPPGSTTEAPPEAAVPNLMPNANRPAIPRPPENLMAKAASESQRAAAEASQSRGSALGPIMGLAQLGAGALSTVAPAVGLPLSIGLGTARGAMSGGVFGGVTGGIGAALPALPSTKIPIGIDLKDIWKIFGG